MDKVTQNPPTLRQQIADLATLRMQIAQYRCDLEIAEDACALAKAQAEQRVIESFGDPKALGSNAEERARNLLVAIWQDDEPFLLAQERARQLERGLAVAQTQLDSALDRRRAREWAIRERVVVVMERAGMADDDTDEVVAGALDEELQPTPVGLTEGVAQEWESVP